MNLLLEDFIRFYLSEAYTTTIDAPEFVSTTTSDIAKSKKETKDNLNIPYSTTLQKLSDSDKQKSKEILNSVLIDKKNINIKYNQKTPICDYIIEALVDVYQKSNTSSYKSFILNNIIYFLDISGDNNLRKVILNKANGLILPEYPDNVFVAANPNENVLQSLNQVFHNYLKGIIDNYNSDNGTKPHFVQLLVTSLSRRLKTAYISFKQYEKKQQKKLSSEKNIDKGFLYNMIKDPLKWKLFQAANKQITNLLSGKTKLIFDLFMSGESVENILEDYPQFFKDSYQIKDIFKYIKKNNNIPNIYYRYGFSPEEIDFENWGLNKFKQDKSHEKKIDKFLEGRLRKLIKENISKLFENYEDDYLSSFEIDNVPEMRPGGEAHKTFMRDLESEPSMGKYKEITDEEFEALIKGMQQANLELPSDQELIRTAEKNIHRQLKNSEVDKLLRTKKQMEDIMGFGSYNESINENLEAGKVFLGYHSSRVNLKDGYHLGVILDVENYSDVIRTAYSEIISDYDENLENDDFEAMNSVFEENGYRFTYVSNSPIMASSFQADKYKYGNNLYKVYGDGTEILLDDDNEVNADIVVSKKPLFFETVEE